MKKIQVEAVLQVQDFGISTVVQRHVETTLFCGILSTENSTGVGKVSRNNLYLNHQGTGAMNKQQINEMDNVCFILVYMVCSTVPDNVLFILL